MKENNIIITGIYNIAYDSLVLNKPYIPMSPRYYHAMAYILEGCLRYTVNKTASVVTKDEILFIRRGFIDIAQVEDSVECTYITVDFSTFDDDFSLACRHSATGKSDVFKEHFKNMLDIWRMGTGIKTMFCIEALYKVINILLSETYENDVESYKFKRVAPVVEYINDHFLDNDFKIGSLEDVGKMSGVNLNRLMKELYGMTISGYVIQKRIETAKTLLTNSMNSVSEIANRCGWADIYSFSHAFKKITGKSPSEWRISH